MKGDFAATKGKKPPGQKVTLYKEEKREIGSEECEGA